MTEPWASVEVWVAEDNTGAALEARLAAFDVAITDEDERTEEAALDNSPEDTIGVEPDDTTAEVVVGTTLLVVGAAFDVVVIPACEVVVTAGWADELVTTGAADVVAFATVVEATAVGVTAVVRVTAVVVSSSSSSVASIDDAADCLL